MQESSTAYEPKQDGMAIREPIAEYVRNKEIPTFFGQPLLRGEYAHLDRDRLDLHDPVLFYSQPKGEIWVGDAMIWLRSLESASADLVFADPPYNIKKAEWDTFESKYPEHPQAETSQYRKGTDAASKIWQPHPKGAKPRDVIEIPTTCNGMHEKTPHPTQKPEELLRKLVLAAPNPGDLITDHSRGRTRLRTTHDQYPGSRV